MTHELKTWPEFYHAILQGRKTFEVRKADRDFAVGDQLLLREWDQIAGRYTGRKAMWKITYIMHGGDFGIQPGYCVLGIV